MTFSLPNNFPIIEFYCLFPLFWPRPLFNHCPSFLFPQIFLRSLLPNISRIPLREIVNITFCHNKVLSKSLNIQLVLVSIIFLSFKFLTWFHNSIILLIVWDKHIHSISFLYELNNFYIQKNKITQKAYIFKKEKVRFKKVFLILEWVKFSFYIPN